jgi:signal transduction histidine kinase
LRPLPLKWRLSLLVALVLAIVVAAISAVAYIELHESLRADLDETLLVLANGIMAEVEEPPEGAGPGAAVAPIVRTATHLKSVRYRVWLDGQAKDLAAGGHDGSRAGEWLRDVPDGVRPPADGKAFGDLAGPKAGHRAVWIRRPTIRGAANVVVAASDRQVYHEMHEFLTMLLAVGASMIVVGALVGTLVALWAIRPIGRTAERLRGITHRNLAGEDLSDLRAPSELAPFIAAVAELLSRLDRALRHERQFTADASHELRTPLALAKSTLQAARTRDRTTAEYQQAIDETLTDVARMERLISQLLSLARIDETSGLPEAADVPLDAVLTHVTADLADLASRRGVKIEIGPLPPTLVRGSEEQLVQLFSNLVENAIVHGPQGGTVRVTLAHEADRDCAVSVHDEGGAIPPEILLRLFDRFYRADNSRTRATGGTGLGLAIAREIACRHGGDIVITSSPATGTRAVVSLPKG